MSKIQTDSKSSINAFIMTLLVILLCLVCLTGATLALFTNDPNDGTIGIITTTGSVKIDIVDAGEGNSLVGGVLEFRTSSDRKEIYFEPGATYQTQGFKIKNLGDIPVNFRLSVSEDVDFDMNEFLEAFDIRIIAEPAVSDAASQGEELSTFKGTLEAGDSTDTTYYLVVKMKENVGNTFQGKTYSGIGVTVYAVQGNVEIED